MQHNIQTTYLLHYKNRKKKYNKNKCDYSKNMRAIKAERNCVYRAHKYSARNLKKNAPPGHRVPEAAKNEEHSKRSRDAKTQITRCMQSCMRINTNKEQIKAIILIIGYKKCLPKYFTNLLTACKLERTPSYSRQCIIYVCYCASVPFMMSASKAHEIFCIYLNFFLFDLVLLAL